MRFRQPVRSTTKGGRAADLGDGGVGSLAAHKAGGSMASEVTVRGWLTRAPYDDSAFPPVSDGAHRSSNPVPGGPLEVAVASNHAQHACAGGRRFDRETVAALARTATAVLEVGSGPAPLLAGPHVAYADLPERIAAGGGTIPTPNRDLSAVVGSFDLVFGDGLLPLQPDLAGHLAQVGRLLRPGGVYVAVVPDRRFGRDFFRPESTVGDAIEALISRPTEHGLRTAVADAVLATHDDPDRHWRGDHGAPASASADAVFAAMQEFDRTTSAGAYADRRSWVFTPQTFREIVRLLDDVGVTGLRPLRIYDTPPGGGDFFAVLQRRAEARSNAEPHHAAAIADIEPQGWNAGDEAGAFVAETTLTDPLLRLTLREPISRPATVRLAFSSRRIETLRLTTVTAAGNRNEAWFNLFQPHLIDHPFLSCTVTANVACGVFEIATTLDANAADPIVALEMAIDEEANWRVHYWHIWDELRVPPQAPAGARLAIHGLQVEDVGSPPRGPTHGVLANPSPARYAKTGAAARDAVLLASWAPEAALPVGDHLLATLARHHADSKIFVGINHGSCPAWEEAVRRSGLDVEVCPAATGITTDSDVAGFLAALDALRRSEERFDLVWFGHTKGASSPDLRAYARVRWTLEKRFWSRRDVIDGYFADPRIGLYAPNYMVPWRGFRFDADALERMVGLPARAFSIVAMTTFYVMRDATVRDFCGRAPESLFTHGVEPFGGTRYFFEWGMPSYPLMLGLDPYIERGIGRTTLPRTRDLGATIWADERQNHALVRRQFEIYRADPAGYETTLTESPIEANEISRLPAESQGRAAWVELAGTLQWSITTS